MKHCETCTCASPARMFVGLPSGPPTLVIYKRTETTGCNPAAPAELLNFTVDAG